MSSVDPPASNPGPVRSRSGTTRVRRASSPCRSASASSSTARSSPRPTRGLRVLETAGAPVYYVPPEDVRPGRGSSPSARRTVCEWKGERGVPHATSARTAAGSRTSPGRTRDPNPGYEAIRGHLAFYAGRVDEAWVGDERATPQPGGFYGGWVTSRIVGPIKGEPGSFGW